MSLGVCIPDLIEQGKIPASRAAEITQIYDELRMQYLRDFDEDTAASMATEATLKTLDNAALQKRRMAVKQQSAQLRAWKNLSRYRKNDGDNIHQSAASALIDADDKAPFANVKHKAEAVKGRAHAMIDRLLKEHRETVFGTARNRAQEEDIVRAAFGELDDNINARELADSWAQASEYLRKSFNSAGGHIAKMKRWALPQSHDAALVRNVDFDGWRDFIAPLLDRKTMVDRETGLPFSDARLDVALRDSYETIRTDGFNKKNAGAIGGKSLANRHADHRFLIFKDADSWLAYNERFGAAGPLESMKGHIDRMSRDIGAMSVLGPNPDATVRFVGDMMQKRAAAITDDGGKALDSASVGAKKMATLYDEYMGRNNEPESRRLALGFSAFRAVQTSAKLGGAVISAVGDVALQMHTRRFNSLPATKTIADYVKLLNPVDRGDQQLAVRMGLVAEEWSNASAAMNRMVGEELSGEFSRRLANFTLKASGLSAWTQAGRWAFGMEFVSAMTSAANRSFDNLDPGFRNMLDRNGIGSGQWDLIRQSPQRNERGANWLFPTDIEDQDLGDLVLGMIRRETDYAVPTVDLRTKALINNVGKSGTWAGEIARSTFLFKSFGLTVLNTHGRRALEQQGAWKKAQYAAGLTTLTTLAGAFVLQLKELQKGKDAKPMTSPEFWGKAMAQGGGWGIFGDFIGASENRFGGGFAETLAGPGVQTVANVADLSVGNAMKLVRGDKTDFWKDTLRLMRQEVPVASSLWYVKPAYDRLILQQLDAMVNPEHDAQMQKAVQRAEKDGQDYYLSPDPFSSQANAVRAPDFGNSINGNIPE